MANTIKCNETVIIRSNEDKEFSVVTINGDQKIGKSRINLKSMIGMKYGTVFEVNKRKLILLTGEEAGTWFDEEINMDVETSEEKALRKDMINQTEVNRGDNSFYVDTNTAQKLTDQDIMQLRDSGMRGEQIIKALMDNSDTFATKTEFAQQKWIKRKEKKYVKKIRVYKSNPSTLCEACFYKNREKICGMRYDVLAQILGQSGVHSGGIVLVVESMVGLLVGSIAYRMRGEGSILAVYGGQQPHFDMVNNLNLDEKSIEIIQNIPSNELGPAAAFVRKHGFLTATDQSMESDSSNLLMKPQLDVTSSEEDMVSDAPTGTGDTVTGQQLTDCGLMNPKTSTTRPMKSALCRTGRTLAEKEIISKKLRCGVDSLIIATKYWPLPILKQSLTLLSSSCHFVVYHEFLEPLVDCYHYLHDGELALRLQLSDTWMREYQILPGRMRPDMFTTTSGGYMLSGIHTVHKK